MRRTACRLVLLGFSIGCLIANAQVSGLSFRPIDARYSLAMDRIIMITGAPNQLHIYNPSTQADKTVPLAEVPTNFSLSSDGTHAAVAFADAVAQVDLQAASVTQTFSNIAVGTGIVIYGSGYIYVFPSYQGSIVNINIATGQATTGGGFYESGGVYDPALNVLYSTEDGLSPNDIYEYNVSGGVIGNTSPKQAPYWGNYSICGPLTLSHDGATIYTSCGTVFQASSNTSQDMLYVGGFPGISQSQSIATSDSLHETAVIPAVPSYSSSTSSTADTVVDLFDPNLNQVGQFATTPFVEGSTSYPAHGRWAFYNSTSSAMYIITQADSTAALELDYALEVVDLTKANSCNATFNSTSISAAAAGGYATTQIAAGESCVFTATSNVPWIVLTAGYYGSGNTTLTYLVRPNLAASSRTGTINLGGQVLTIAQDAAGALSDQNPLSFKPVAADYSKALDNVVMVSTSPNELHLYNPLTQADQIIPLAYNPLSVSVSPDGLFAAVGHNRYVSYVDLQGLKVSKLIPVSMSADTILLAGNGYAYTFSSQVGLFLSTNAYSVQLSTGTLTAFSATATSPRLYSDGNFIYLGGSGKLDISKGPATLVTNSSYTGVNGTNIWLSEDGVRLITSTGNAYFTSVVPSQDLTADGSLSAATSVAWAANSENQHETAVLLGDSYSSPAANTQLQIYADKGLQLQQQLAMPGFSVGGTSYASHGRFVFWNAAETKLFAFTEADSTSGLLSDYAEYTVAALSSIPACSYVVSPNPLNLGPTYSYGAFLNVATACSWSASVASNNWLGSYISGATLGNGSITLYVQPNTGAARSTTVTVGGQTVTVNQAASTCTYTLSSTSQSFSQAGGNGSVTLTTGSGCAWTVQSYSNWLTITSPQSGTGPATILYRVAPNNSTTTYLSSSFTVAGTASFAVNETTVPVSPALSFVPLTPCRVADTRLATGPFGGPYLSALTTRTIYITSSSCNVPAAAAAYSLNVTVVPHSVLYYLTVWPSGEAQPFVSTLNSDGRIKADAAIIPAGLGGVNIYATNDTDVVLDINGYFVAAASSTSALEFYPLAPCRIADTRDAAGSFGGPYIGGGQTRDFPIVQSACNVPSSAGAYSLNYTAVPMGGLSYLSTWPAGQAKPLVSTLNAETGTVTANAAIVPAGTKGDVNVFATDNTNLVIDVNGYFAAPATGGLHFYAVAPCRVLDTRISGTEQPLNGTMTIPVAGSCSVPSNASAVVVNATVVPVTSLAYLSLWPNGVNLPLVSTLNAPDQAITSNMAIVPMGNGSINAYSPSGTHLILDINGYFAP